MTQGTNTMSVSDRLAMKLKESELGALLSEDDIILIAREAIEKAFFKPVVQERKGEYSPRYDTSESPILAMAREVFKARFVAIVDPVIKEFAASEAFHEALGKAIQIELPGVLMGMSQGALYQTINQAVGSLTENYDFGRRIKDLLARS